MKSTIIIEELIDNSHRLLMFRMLLLILMVFGLIFVILNYTLDGIMQTMVIEIFFVFCSAIIFFNLENLISKPYYQTLVTVYVSTVCLLNGYIFSIGSTLSIQLWILAMPLLSYLLLGKKQGFWITLITITASCCSLYLQFGPSLGFIGLKFAINSAGVFSCIWIVAHAYEDANYNAQLKISKTASTDTLTGLLNRSIFSAVFDKYKHNECCFLLLDIDWFKSINDNYGHEIGDKVLIDFAKLQAEFFDDKGYVFRVGGEEFCVFFPNTIKKNAYLFADEFINIVRNHVIIADDVTIQITFSGGIASSPTDSKVLNELMNIADQNLYKAKHSGRNQVV